MATATAPAAPADNSTDAAVTDSKQVRALVEQLTSIVAELKVLIDEEKAEDAAEGETVDPAVADAAVQERVAKMEELTSRGDALRSQIDRLRKVAVQERQLRSMVLKSNSERAVTSAPVVEGNVESRSMSASAPSGATSAIKPYGAPSRGHIRGFGSGPDAERRAYAVGQWALGFLYGRQESRRWCEENGVIQSRDVQAIGTATLGGNLVPTLLSDQTIQLINEYGEFKAAARNVNMPAPYYEVPRRTGGLRMYPMGENTATTVSAKTWDKVALTAKKWAVENRLSNEVLADAVIDLASDITEEMAIAFAAGIDDAGFNGTGSTSGDPNYQGIVGVIPAMTGSSHAGTYVSPTATSFETLTLNDFVYALAKVPKYARTPNLAFFISPVGYAAAIQRIKMAQGGNAGSDIEGGGTPNFLGIPVKTCNALDGTLGTDYSKVKCILADLNLGATFGSLRDITYRTSTERLFELDTTIMQATARFDIKVHGTGTSSVVGPIVVIETKAAPGS